MKPKKGRLFKIFSKGSKKSQGENDLKNLNHSTKLTNFFTKNEILAQVTPLKSKLNVCDQVRQTLFVPTEKS